MSDGPAPAPAFPVVAVGSSAGGVEALVRLVEQLPSDTGMAFVLVPHLAPDSPSHLVEILQRATTMTVAAGVQGAPLAPDRIVVIPPGVVAVVADGVLDLSPPEAHGRMRSIDLLLRSVAAEFGHRSIGVLLSGASQDGTLGLAEIKAAGGITFAQDDSARHAEMPLAAIGAGAVDFVLSPAEIALELARIARHPYVADPAADASARSPMVARIVDLLHEATGVDFSSYKRNTLHRRIARRMALRKLPDLGAYLDLLRSDSAETQALYGDVLIGVTSFFRDPAAYAALAEKVFPRLTEGRGPQDPIRVWTLGCSTGEEAYSIAMSYLEFQEKQALKVRMQVFATDLNGAAIDKARAGVYPRAALHEMAPERLARHFVPSDGTYRVGRQVRDMCVFARQNALTDPPFSNIDLVSCRNFLIYMEPALQQRLIPIMHYALRDNGFLWLGSSETIGPFRDLFEPLDAPNRIYAKRPAARRLADAGSRASLWSLPPARGRAPVAPRESASAAFDPQREAERVIIARYGPPGVVVDPDLEILQFRGDTSPFVAPAPGRPSLNLMKMLREGLVAPVRAAMQRARREDMTIREEGLRVKSGGTWRDVDVVVIPLKGAGSASGTMLILFEETGGSLGSRVRQLEADASAADAEATARPVTRDDEVKRLSAELAATRDYLQSVIEQQEAANEELQSANEEVQSADEELQSINEELETSKEEVQAANEELATMNDELEVRNQQLSRANNDFTKLLASVQMAIVMLGADLRVRRFTPAAEKILGLGEADVDRRVGDVKFAIPLEGVEKLALEVMETVATQEREVRDASGHSYLMRMRPYRSSDNRIEGVVLMLIDVNLPPQR